MIVPFLIMLREGLEAAMIVGIVAGYLARTGQRQWMPAVWAGVLLASVLCISAGVLLDLVSDEFPQREQEIFEAVIGLVAVCMLCSMVFWMKQAGRNMGGRLHASVDAALRPGDRQGLALTGMVFLAVAREGLEAVFFLLAVFRQSSGWEFPAGAVAGLAAAALLGFGLYRGGLKLDLRRFFRWSGVFILFVAAGLLAGSVRSLHEAGLWNGLQTVAFDLSAVLPSGSLVGTILSGIFGYHDAPTVGEVAAYLALLVPALILFLGGPSSRPVARPAALP